MECHDAQRALAKPNNDGTDEAKRHVTTCPNCLSRFDQFAQAILSMDENEISCAECGARLPAYREVEERGEELSEQLVAVTDHLNRCPYCAEEYRALQETMAAWDAGALPELEHPQRFDLSFLEATPAERALWLPEAAGQVRKLFSEIVVTLGEKMASFGSLPPPLVPSPVPARALRAEGDEIQAQVLELPDPEANLVIDLIVGPVSAGEAALRLEIGQISPQQPISRARVTLYDAEHQLLASTLPGIDGTVTFDDMEAGRYIIRVKHRNRIWEFPVSLTQADGDEGSTLQP